MELNLKQVKDSDKLPSPLEQCCVYNHDMRTWFFATVCTIGKTHYWEGSDTFDAIKPDDIYIVLPTFG